MEKRHYGWVLWWFKTKPSLACPFGCIGGDDGVNYFFLISSSLPNLTQGERVSFIRGKPTVNADVGPDALQVRLVKRRKANFR